jgi:hypothetical protein
MEDTTPSPENHDAVPGPDTVGPERNHGDLVREVREVRHRIEADQLDENSLQRHIIKKLRSAGTVQRTSCD